MQRPLILEKDIKSLFLHLVIKDVLDNKAWRVKNVTAKFEKNFVVDFFYFEEISCT